MRRSISLPLLCAALGLSVAGIAGFFLLFIPRMNVYWLILAPVIFAVYQIPAVVVYALGKRRRTKGLAGPDEPPAQAEGDAIPPERFSE